VEIKYKVNRALFSEIRSKRRERRTRGLSENSKKQWNPEKRRIQNIDRAPTKGSQMKVGVNLVFTRHYRKGKGTGTTFSTFSESSGTHLNM
jgi:hypothetical protein